MAKAIKTADKTERPDRGIETIFRVSSGNNQRLSDMADKKANIMITVNAIILSAVLSILIRKLEDETYLIIPTFMLVLVSLTTMIFAILATRPTVPQGTFSLTNLDKKGVNLLFFGNFYKMSLADYETGMLKIMDDRDLLYGSLILDTYAQGKVLGKKYRLLRLAYNIFMFGLIAAIAAFMIAVILNSMLKA